MQDIQKSREPQSVRRCKIRRSALYLWNGRPRRFQTGDKAIQTENGYDKDVFNGDIGTIERIAPVEHEVAIRFDDRMVKYDFGELDEVALAYAVTIHKSQGSEFPAVLVPLPTQHYMLLQRNLIYTGITGAGGWWW